MNLDQFLDSNLKSARIFDSNMRVALTLDDNLFFETDQGEIEKDFVVIDELQTDEPGVGNLSYFMDKRLLNHPLLKDRSVLITNVGSQGEAKGIHQYVRNRPDWEELFNDATGDVHYLLIR